VQVQRVPPSSPTPASATASVPITPTPTAPRSIQVRLTPNKPHARVGEIVTFTISTVPDVPDLDYQFDAGDGSPIEHGNARPIRHTYRKPSDSYTASVTLPGARYRALATIPIPANGGFAWWIFYVVSAGLAAAALLLYRILKWFAVQPTVHLHPDWDAPRQSEENLAINYGLYFHSNISAGRDQLQTDRASLIL